MRWYEEEDRTDTSITKKDLALLKDSLKVGQHVKIKEIACEEGKSRYINVEYVVTGIYKHGFTVRKILDNGSTSPASGFKQYVDLMIVGCEE